MCWDWRIVFVTFGFLITSCGGSDQATAATSSTTAALGTTSDAPQAAVPSSPPRSNSFPDARE